MKKRNLFIISAILALLTACTSHPSVPETFTEAGKRPVIYPDYKDVTVPCNIAPLNFSVMEKTDNSVARFTFDGGSYTYGEGHKIQIDIDEWKEMLAAAKGKSIKVEVFAQKDGEWKAFKPFDIHVAEDEIDPYMSYRLIQPSYVAYENLSINQRNLTNFEEKDIYNNMLVSNDETAQCINCHSYKNHGTDNMQFHMRQGFGGTMIVCNGEAKKVDLKTDSTISAGVYPSWHPKLNLIAYSTNLTGQGFHTKSAAKIDVQDTRSDLILYNIDKNEVSNISAIKNELEVFPWWAPDGKSIYFCSAHFEYRDTTSEETQMIERYHEVKHNIYRKPFDEKTMTFGDTELVYNAEKDSMSATFPRISPDGRYLLFALGNHGCFHVWHPEADLYLTDLTTMQTRKLENINSAQSESYHSWSSNGRWIVVGSRRDDGNYTRPYIAYFDKQGKAHKPFILPQEDPDFYRYFMRSFNIPEFMKEPVAISPQEFAEVAKTDALKANFKSTEQNHGVLQESVSKYDSIRVDGMTGASPKRPESKDHTVN